MPPLIDQNRNALAALCRRFGVRRLDLFGSAVGEKFNDQSSDLDFLVSFETPDSQDIADRYLGLLVELEDLFARRIDLISDRGIKNPYFRQAVDEEKVSLYVA